MPRELKFQVASSYRHSIRQREVVSNEDAIIRGGPGDLTGVNCERIFRSFMQQHFAAILTPEQ